MHIKKEIKKKEQRTKAAILDMASCRISGKVAEQRRNSSPETWRPDAGIQQREEKKTEGSESLGSKARTEARREREERDPTGEEEHSLLPEPRLTVWERR